MKKAQRGKAEALVQEAESLLAKKTWFSSSKQQNTEEAAETYEKAANAYKVGGLNQEAGDMYTKAAELYRDSLTDLNHASKAFNNAGKKLNFKVGTTFAPWSFFHCPFHYSFMCQVLLTITSICFWHFVLRFYKRNLLQKEQSSRCRPGFCASSITVYGQRPHHPGSQVVKRNRRIV